MRCPCVCMLQDWKTQSNCKWTVPFTVSYTFREKKNMLRGRLIVNSYLFDSHASRSFYSHIYILINEPFFEKTLKTLSSIKRVSPCIVSACISVGGCSTASQSCCFEVYCRPPSQIFFLRMLDRFSLGLSSGDDGGWPHHVFSPFMPVATKQSVVGFFFLQHGILRCPALK